MIPASVVRCSGGVQHLSSVAEQPNRSMRDARKPVKSALNGHRAGPARHATDSQLQEQHEWSQSLIAPSSTGKREAIFAEVGQHIHDEHRRQHTTSLCIAIIGVTYSNCCICSGTHAMLTACILPCSARPVQQASNRPAVQHRVS